MLAKCLRDLPDVTQALAAYERLRRERAEKVVAYSHRMGRSKTISNPVGVWVRDGTTRSPERAQSRLGTAGWVSPGSPRG